MDDDSGESIEEVPVVERMSYCGGVKYINGRAPAAPPYLSEHCIPVSSADTRRHLRSANRHLLAVPRFPPQHLRPSGVFGCWPDGLELTPGFYPGSSEQHKLFWAST